MPGNPAAGHSYLLQGLVHCQQCGYAFYGKPISRKASQGQDPCLRLLPVLGD